MPLDHPVIAPARPLDERSQRRLAREIRSMRAGDEYAYLGARNVYCKLSRVDKIYEIHFLLRRYLFQLTGSGTAELRTRLFACRRTRHVATIVLESVYLQSLLNAYDLDLAVQESVIPHAFREGVRLYRERTALDDIPWKRF